MSPLKPFLWTPPREQAAQLVADDGKSDQQIAEQIGVTKRQLERWKLHAEFRARVKAIREVTRAALIDQGIAAKQNRIDAYNRRWRLMQQVIDERAANPALQAEPGGKTGLIVRSFKFSPTGDTVEEFAVDVALLKELREHEKQAATELSQWVEKKDVTSAGKPIEFTIQIDRQDREQG